jgi:RHS repeat-associated protein
LGDRLTQNGVQYTLDLNTGLTQVLRDGTNTYLYGLGCLAERADGVNEFYLGDALGSVRQLTNPYGEVVLTKSYDPYGNNLQSLGTGQTVYGFTGETTDANGLIYLRARYYNMALKYVHRRFFLTRKISPFGNRFLACNLYVVSRVRSKTAV